MAELDLAEIHQFGEVRPAQVGPIEDGMVQEASAEVGPDQAGSGAPPDQAQPGSGGGDQAGPGDPTSPAEISQELANGGAQAAPPEAPAPAPAPASPTASAAGAGGGAAPASDDPSIAAGANGATPDTATTTPPDPTPNPAAVPDLPPDFNPSPDAAAKSPADEAPMNNAAPPLSQAGHVGHHGSGAGLWLTGLAFGALLLLGVGWLWTRRRLYDAA